MQDEAEMSLFPTLTRMWMVRGQPRKIRAPGGHPPQCHEWAATDWRTGERVRIRSEKRNAAAFCRLMEKCLRRSARCKRRVVIVSDGARIHTPEGSRPVAEFVKRSKRRLKLCYVPSYSPECMPMELLWNDWRDQVTHNHDRLKMAELEGDSDRYFARRARQPKAVWKTIGSPFLNRRQNYKN